MGTTFVGPGYRGAIIFGRHGISLMERMAASRRRLVEIYGRVLIDDLIDDPAAMTDVAIGAMALDLMGENDG